MSDIVPINFALSDAAKIRLEQLKEDFNERFAGDPAAVVGFAWGYELGSSPETGNVAIGFYRESEMWEIEPFIQEAFGMKVVFSTTEALAGYFEGKLLDADGDGRLFLRVL
jgi:hypothetical protein